MPSTSAPISLRGSSSARRAGSVPSTSRSTVSRSRTRDAVVGTVLLGASAAAYSSAGLYTRLIDLDAWTMLFWRGLFGGLFLAGMVAWRERGRVGQAVLAIGRDGMLIGFGSALATVCFLNALRLSTVADVLVIDATIPFVTAGMAWLVLREHEDRITLAATLAAVAGVAVMMGAAEAGGRLPGNVLAFGMVVLMSLVLVLIRRNPGVSMLPAVGLSAFLCALIVLPFAKPLAVSTRELLLLALFGASQFGLGLLLLALGTPLVSATRGALIGVLQTPLGTFWVWLALGEAPAPATLAGGVIVVAAVVCDIAIGRPREKITSKKDPPVRRPRGSAGRPVPPAGRSDPAEDRGLLPAHTACGVGHSRPARPLGLAGESSPAAPEGRTPCAGRPAGQAGLLRGRRSPCPPHGRGHGHSHSGALT
ncbi:putative membrane protein [Ostertagia ostertagi]